MDTEILVYLQKVKSYIDIARILDSETKLIDLWGLWEDTFNHDYTRLGDFFEVK